MNEPKGYNHIHHLRVIGQAIEGLSDNDPGNDRKHFNQLVFGLNAAGGKAINHNLAIHDAVLKDGKTFSPEQLDAITRTYIRTLDEMELPDDTRYVSLKSLTYIAQKIQHEIDVTKMVPANGVIAIKDQLQHVEASEITDRLEEASVSLTAEEIINPIDDMLIIAELIDLQEGTKGEQVKKLLTDMTSFLSNGKSNMVADFGQKAGCDLIGRIQEGVGKQIADRVAKQGDYAKLPPQHDAFIELYKDVNIDDLMKLDACPAGIKPAPVALKE